MKPQRPQSAAHPPRPPQQGRSGSVASDASSNATQPPPSGHRPQRGQHRATAAAGGRATTYQHPQDEFFLTSIGRSIDYKGQAQQHGASGTTPRSNTALASARSNSGSRTQDDGSLYSFDVSEVTQHDVLHKPNRPSSASGRKLVMPSSLMVGKMRPSSATKQTPSAELPTAAPLATTTATTTVEEHSVEKATAPVVPPAPPTAAAPPRTAPPMDSVNSERPPMSDAEFEEEVRKRCEELREEAVEDHRSLKGKTNRYGGASPEQHDAMLREALRLAIGTRALKFPPQAAVAPDDERAIAGMSTAEDVVAFFSSHSRSYTPVKFFTMTLPPRLDGQRFRPYDLLTVSRDAVDRRDYYIMTASAVVHIMNGQPTDVTLLSEFVRETSLFNVVSRIRFFRNYLTYKAFQMWHRNIRLKNFNRVRRKLCLHFFPAKSTFAAPLIHLKKLSFDLARQPLLQLPNTREGIAKEKFAQLVSEQRVAASHVFQETLEAMEKFLLQLCEKAVANAKIPDLATPEALNQYLMALEEEEIRQSGARRVNIKSISMVAMKEKAFARMRSLKASMDDLTLLPNFIRLVDYFGAEALFRNALLSLHQLNWELNRTDEEKLLFFIAAVTFQGTEGIVFHPCKEDFATLCADVAAEMIGAVASAPRLLMNRAFKDHFDLAPRVVGMGQALQRDQRVAFVNAETRARIAADFDEAAEATKHYAKNRVWYQWVSKEWSILKAGWDERWKREQNSKSLIDSMDPACAPLMSHEFAAVFKTVEDAFSSLKEMHPLRRGCLVITSANVLEFLFAKLKEIQVELRSLLTSVAASRLDRLALTYSTRMKAIVDRPPTLRKYAAFVALLNEVVAEGTRLEEIALEVDELFDTAEANSGDGMTLETGRRALVLGGTANQNQGNAMRDRYEAAVQAAKDFRAAALKDMARKLEQDIEQEREVIYTTLSMVETPILVTFTTETAEVMEYLAKLENTLNASAAKMKTFIEWQKLFGVGSEDLSSVDQLRQAYKAKLELWTSIEKWNRLKVEYYSTPIAEVDMTVFAKEVDELYVAAYSKLQPRHKNDASERLLEQVKEEKVLMPTLLQLGNKNLRREHWAKILANQQRAYDPSLSLDSLRQIRMLDPQYRDVIAEQSSIASGEANLIATVDALRDRWDTIEFEVKSHRDSKDTFILNDVSEIVAQLEEDQMVVQSCLANRHVSGIRARVDEWEAKLTTLGQVIEEWVYVQGNWMYLEFIFTSDDIKKQLPAESTAFKATATDFKELMNRARSVKNCIVVATEGNVLATLQMAHSSLDHILRKIEDYLETKRSAFPRFYFLSNDELLLILSDSRDTRAVRPHLRKCFDSIKDLEFRNEAGTEISAMISAEGEYVPFTSIVSARGPVEVWLGNIEKMMVTCLQEHLRVTESACRSMRRTDWILNVQDADRTVLGYPAQCIQCVDMIEWTRDVEVAIDSGISALKKYLDKYKKQIIDSVSIVRMKLSKLQRALIGTLLVVDVHNRDVVESVIAANVTAVTDFTWNMQLRYYADSDGLVEIRHVDARFGYSYEYLGSSPRLVITPLTDRAFLTCTSALHMNLGGAPQGPAGTGKTESVKDLGKALARQVVVFNCSDGINNAMMSQMFAGLAQGGAWACFDEFNRIELEVLSVVAQQMLDITRSIARKLPRMVFDGHDIALHPNFGVFITMNPGYAGRTELPDNLKALFRPVCMMIPDYRLIAEIMFFSEGFENARTLSTKMVLLYRLSSEQLSKQDHYDFGMRAVKSILVMAGSLKRAEPDADEDMLLIRAMRDSNIPKFLRDDAILFNALISDLYPSVAIVDKTNDELDKAIQHDLVSRNLQPIPLYIGKVIQLHETMLVRHGVMMVGQSLTGKSNAYETLQRSLTALKTTTTGPPSAYYQTTHQHIVNPKSVTRDELYGAVNATTREWNDGLLSKIVRHVVGEANHSQDRHWIVFDGPVDAVWIENMNTVLDDNKMLCLVNGERLKLPDTITCCFEVQDLRHASPATVSRCGMVYVEPYYLGGGWKPVLASVNAHFAARHGPALWPAAEVQSTLTTLIDALYQDLSALAQCCEWIPSVPAQQVIGTLNLLSALIDHIEEDDDDPLPPKLPAPQLNDDGIPLPVDAVVLDVEPPVETPPPVKRVEAKLVKKLLVFAFIWGFGGNYCEKQSSRSRFSTIMLRHISAVDPDFPGSEMLESATSAATVFDVKVRKKSMSWVSWASVVPKFVYQRASPFFDLLVPTAETMATRTIVALMLKAKHHVLLNGTTGTGKSAGLQSLLLDTLNAEDPTGPWQSFSLVLSAQTSSRQLQEKYESKLRSHPSRGKNLVIGPAAGKTMIALIDDINMPMIEEYGASPPAELVRQIIVQGGMFDRKKNVFKEVSDVIQLACCGPPGGGKNELTQRLTSRFFLLCQPSLSSDAMHKIFHSILRGFLSAFPADVSSIAAELTAATIDAYRETSQSRLPTPEKSHYTFNLRDVSRVVQGLVQAHPRFINSRRAVIELWSHETSRVFHDRLVDDEDRQWWWKTQRGVILRRFHVDSPDDERNTLLYGDFGSLDDDERLYKRIEISPALHDILTEKMLAYGIQFSREMNLVLFDDAVRHLARICRILRQPRGHALLVGVGGSGRQSLAQLAAFIIEAKIYTISVSRTYGIVDFREDLRRILMETGCDNKPSAFILSDTQLVKEQFLEDLNNLLNTGEVANVFQPEDTEKMMSAVRDEVQALGKPETQNVLLSHFTGVCRNNLHIVLAMSPAGNQFRSRIRMFPSLTNCMTVDWFAPWPESALLSVAQRVLADLSLESEHLRAALCKLAVAIHTSVKIEGDRFFDEMRRRAYTTPTSYLSLLNLFVTMIRDQSDHLNANIQRFRGGLDKIFETNRKVDEMKGTLIEMQPLLETQSIETSKFARQVEEEQKAASEVAVVVAQEEAACGVIMAEAEAIRNDCQSELDRAMPAYHQALDALNALNPRDINEAKAYAAPPKKVEMVMDAVLTLLDEEKGWDSARRLMGKPDFIQTLKNFDKDNVPDKVIRRLKKYIEMDDFKPEAVQNVSKACVSLCLWCRAVDNYSEVMKVVLPKKESLAAAEERLAVAKGQLDAKQAQLRELEARIATLKVQFDDSMRRKQHLQEEMHRTQVFLSRAERLLTGLADEHERWGKTSVQLADKKPFNVAIAALSAAMTAYTGPFTAPYRKRLLKHWLEVAAGLNIITPSVFNLSDIVESVVVRNWIAKGLPTDEFSVENATILSKSRRWCLCIDPQGQANAWIRRTYADRGLKIIKLGDPNFMRTIENALRIGSPVLLENIGEELDASLDPLLQKQIYRQGTALMIRIRDSAIEYDPNFFFVMTTRLPNPHYLPELQIKVTLLNFTVTFKGLEDQLLGEVVRHERPELEERADRVVVQVADAKAQLTEVEDKILMLLSSASGDLLENEILISTLQQSKATSFEISENLKVAEATQKEITFAREKYRGVATRGSIVFSVISDVSGLEHMYQNSLAFFVKLFNQTLARSPYSESVEERCTILIDAVTQNSFNGICRGMFEVHKPVFALLLATAIARHSGAISDAEWNVFLRGGQGRPPLTNLDNPATDWLPDAKWDELLIAAETSEGMTKACISDGILDDTENWRAFFTGQQELPRSCLQCTDFQQLLLVKTLRDESLFAGARRYVRDTLGSGFVDQEAFDLAASFSDSSPVVPIVIVLSVGTDPTAMFSAFADQKGFGSKMHLVSMGQGQGPKAEAAINRASQSGEWVYLQNCHVYTSWMPRLEAIVAETAVTQPHHDYRLWLTTMPCEAFPVSVLQSSLKLTREPPKGLRANLNDTYASTITSEIWTSCPHVLVTWRKLIFALSLMHSVTQERRKFGPLGWNIRYDWNAGDLDASILSLKAYVDRLKPTDNAAVALPWDAIHYLLGNINYGGRVTDDWDLRCLSVLSKRFINPDVVAHDGDEPYRFANDPHFVLPAVGHSSTDDIRAWVSALPEEGPTIFGLHNNASITFDAQASKQLLNWVIDVQPRVGGAASNQAGGAFTTIADLRAKLPMPIDRNMAHVDTYRVLPSGVMTSLGTVCVQEVDRYNDLIAYLAKSLATLDAALRGEVVMDARLEQIYGSLLFFQVPRDWEKRAYPSLRPLLSWFNDFVLRVEFFRDWNDSGVPSSCWLGAFVFPQGFLTGVLQTHSRQFKLPIDQLRFVAKPMADVDPDVAELPLTTTGIYVHGLWLEGARWDVNSSSLAEPKPRELFAPMPIIHLEPVTDPIDAHEFEASKTLCDCPVYKIASRAGVLSTTGISSNFVLALRLNSGSSSPDHWTLRGTALVTSRSE